MELLRLPQVLSLLSYTALVYFALICRAQAKFLILENIDN
jgi:hypothetical protein